VGKPLSGMEVRIVNPNAEGVGEVAARSRSVMSGYLDEPEMTAETIRDGWLYTGDLGRFDPTGHLQLLGRKRNMIVTAEGKNIYPEDIENAFDSLPVKDFCVFAENFLWPRNELAGEKLVLVLHPEPGVQISPSILEAAAARNRALAPYKRVSECLIWNQDFPRTASMKIKREALAEEIRSRLGRESVTAL
jgi:long-chain acyl-CoA synthetase